MSTIVVSGAFANKPGNGGNAWTRLCWINGLASLGYEVVFVEQIDRTGESEQAIRFFREGLARHAPAASACLLDRDDEPLCGLAFDEMRRRAERAVALVNISGHLDIPDIKLAIPRRIYFDDDPGYTQCWHAAGSTAPRLGDHHLYATLGLNIGQPGCPIPTGGITWHGIPPPVDLTRWTPAPVDAFHGFSTVASWRGPYAPPEFQGRTLGVKAHAFRAVAELPERTGFPFTIAVDIHPADARDRERMASHGWRLLAPETCAGSPEAYRDFIRNASAECSVAQGMYTETGSGWFSDRTARYLACGRPALVQDTGFGRVIPTGRGIVTFRTLDEAVEGARAIVAEYAAHAHHARALAEKYFDARVILRDLLRKAGVPDAKETAS